MNAEKIWNINFFLNQKTIKMDKLFQTARYINNLYLGYYNRHRGYNEFNSIFKNK